MRCGTLMHAFKYLQDNFSGYLRAELSFCSVQVEDQRNIVSSIYNEVTMGQIDYEKEFGGSFQNR